MKKIILSLTLLLTVAIVYSQSLKNTIWQLQNPEIKSLSSSIYFDKFGNFSMVSMNLATSQQITNKGFYKETEYELKLTVNEKTFTYQIERINDYVIHLIYNEYVYIYASVGSSYDKFFVNYMNGYSNYNSYSSSSNYTPVETPKLCYTCGGSGYCVVCKGSGWCSGMYGQSGSSCSACNATGKCWHCYGSGKQ